MEKKDTFKLSVDELRRIVEPIGLAASDGGADGIISFTKEAGINLEVALVTVQPLSDIAQLLGTIYEQLSGSESDTVEIAAQLAQFFSAIREIENLDVRADAVFNAGQIVDRILGYLLVRYLTIYRPALFSFLQMFGVFDPVPGEKSWQISSLFDLLEDPPSFVAARYGWGKDSLKHDVLLGRLLELMWAFNIPCYMRFLEDTRRSFLQQEDLYRADEDLRIPIVSHLKGDQVYSAGFSIVPVERGNSAESPGFAIFPFAEGSLTGDVDLDGGWQFRLRVSGGTMPLYGLVARPEGLRVVDLTGGLPTELVLDTGISRADGGAEPTMIMGVQDGSRLEFRGLGMRTSLRTGVDVNFVVELAALGTRLFIAPPTDGFLSKILPPDGFATDFDLTVGWSSADGLYFGGSSALEVTISVHKTLGPITIDSIYLLIKLREDRSIGISIAASFAGKLGPVSASVQRIGLKTALSFPQDGGNLGLINFDIPGFLPPTGAGLLVEAGGIIGGGLIDFDDVNKRYAGMLALNFGEIGLTAFGLITTRMPDGSDGFSLLVNINVEFNPCIQLSFGFTLCGVGGLIGINRAINDEALHDGLRNRTLDSILFPDLETAVEDAPVIISTMRSVFPPLDNSHVAGVMLKFGWGTPAIIDAEVGIFVELPDLDRIIILGHIEAAFPSQEYKKVELHLNVLGVLDFAQKRLYILASLYNSRILQYPISGDSGIVIEWGKKRLFVESIGGFNPNFSEVPVELQDMRRASIALRSSKRLKLNCEVYQALASDALMFGGRIDAYVKVSKASVEGFLEFHAWINFSPFWFKVSFSGGLTARAFGKKLMAVRLNCTLIGTTPWSIDAKAKFEICWKDFKVKVHKEWGTSERLTIPGIDPWPELKASLERPESWGGKLPENRMPVIAIRQPEQVNAVADESETNSKPEILIHPDATIEIQPNILPFKQKLQKFGNAPVVNRHKFEIESVTVKDGNSQTNLEVEYLDDFFARGQFEELTREQRLALPSFENMPGIILIKGRIKDFASGEPLNYTLKYESIHINKDGISQPAEKDIPVLVNWDLFNRLLAGSAASNSNFNFRGNRKFSVHGAKPRVTMGDEGYVIVRNTDLGIVDLPKNDGTLTRWEADQVLEASITENVHEAEQWQVIPAYEAD